MTILYINKSILICQNSDYISKEWWYLSNQEQFKIEKLKYKRARVFSRYFQSIEKQIIRCIDNTGRLQKTTECCERARECIKGSLIIYLDSWEYWCTVWRSLEYKKFVKRGHRI